MLQLARHRADLALDVSQAVKFEVNSEPVSSICCHCDTCRVTHGATSQRAVLFKKEMVRFDPESYDSLSFYQTHDKVHSSLNPYTER